jgi:thermostable 8-oxoguanine DNA glycosylase
MVGKFLWPGSYEQTGVVIPAQRGSKLELTAEDFLRARRLHGAEQIAVTDSQELFRGAIYCMLTRGTTYSAQERMLDELVAKDLVTPESFARKRSVSAIVKGVQYPNKLSAHLLSFAKEYWPQHGEQLQTRLEEDTDQSQWQSIRSELVDTCPGIGYKCASLLLRMCGYTEPVPLDRWGLRFLRDTVGHPVLEEHDKGKVKNGKNYTRSPRPAQYLAYENAFSSFARSAQIEPAALQMVLYARHTNWDYARHPFLNAPDKLK